MRENCVREGETPQRMRVVATPRAVITSWSTKKFKNHPFPQVNPGLKRKIRFLFNIKIRLKLFLFAGRKFGIMEQEVSDNYIQWYDVQAKRESYTPLALSSFF